MKLSSDKIDEILASTTDYIYDVLWNEFDSEWVEDYLLSNYPDLEYDNEDINTILVGLKESQKEIQKLELDTEKQTLYDSLNGFIENSDTHLSFTDIGRILVKLAGSYLDFNE